MFNPDEARDEKGRWTDAGPAIQKAASDGEVGIAFAPYRSNAVNTPQEDAAIRARPEYKLHQEVLREAAAGIGIQILDNADTWGGYVDSETGKPVQEVSNVIHVNAGAEKAQLLAAILGKAAPEQQDSVLVGTHDPNGSGIEYTIKTGSFDKARKAIDSMKSNGIQYYTINKKNGDIILLDTDNSIHENVTNFANDLKKRGLYESGEFSRTNAEFVSHESYDGIIEKAGIQTKSENGFDINSFIKKATAKYKKVTGHPLASHPG